MTERTKGRRPNYKVLGTTGNFVEVRSSFRQRSAEQPSESLPHGCNVMSGIGLEEDPNHSPLPEVENAVIESTEDGDHYEDAPTEQQLLQQHDILQQQKLLQQSLLFEKEDQERKLLLQQLEDERQRFLLEQERERDIRMQSLMNERSAEELERTVKHLKSQAGSLSEDITDFIDENPAKEFSSSIEDLDKCVARIEDLRSAFRTKHKELLSHCHLDHIRNLEDPYLAKMSEVKSYLKELKSKRKALRDNEEGRRAKLVQDRESKVKFINEEVRRIIKSLNDVFSDDLDTIKSR